MFPYLIQNVTEILPKCKIPVTFLVSSEIIVCRMILGNHSAYPLTQNRQNVTIVKNK